MSHTSKAAILLALVTMVAACITGNLVLSSICTSAGADGACSCTVTSDVGNDVACPPAGTKVLCCAQTELSPTYPADDTTCSCTVVTPPTVVCQADIGNCICAASLAGPGAPTCTAPSAWTACCADTLASSCWCSLTPGATCGDGEESVPNCTTLQYGTCTPVGNECQCTAGVGGPSTCPAAPVSVCCLDTTSAQCSCSYGLPGTCPVGQTVPDCSAKDVEPHLTAAGCGDLETAVASCSLPATN
jgi:hypothetical protein